MNDLTVYNEEFNKPANFMQLENILGKRDAAAFMVGVMTSLRETPALLECPPENVFSEALKGAAYDLPIGGSFGMSWLIPRYSKKHRCQMAAWQPGYKGLKQIAMRTKEHDVINVGELYEGQVIEEDQLSGRVKIVGPRGGKVKGLFGYLHKLNGYEGFVYWSMERLEEHRQKYAASNPMWKTNADDMRRKTVLINLIKEHATLKFRSSLPELFGDEEWDGSASDSQVEDAIQPDPSEAIEEGEFVDGEVVKKSQPQTWNVYDAVVEAGLAENEFSAKNALKKCSTGYDSPEKAIAWMRKYRAARDEGSDSNAAAEMANS